jgi:hypothetical protein
MTSRALRFVVINPYQDIPTSYHCGLGNNNAESWALYNGRMNHGRVLVEMSDGSVEVHADFSRRATRDTQPQPESV